MRTLIKGLRGRGEEGAATVEFAIIAPAVILILLWSIFFSDIAMVKLKVLEAARFAVWEETAFRNPTEVQNDLKDRFHDLRSSDTDQVEVSKRGYMGIKLKDWTPTVKDDITVKFTGNADFGGSTGGVDSALGSISKGLDWILNYAKLSPKIEASSDVSVEVENNIIPGVELLKTKLRGKTLESPLKFSDKEYMVYNTWKAWPNRKSTVGSVKTNETDVYQTYPVAEKYVSEYMRNMAFFGLNKISLLNQMDKFVTKLHLPWPLSTQSFQATPNGKGGPVTMLPIAKINESWVPGHNQSPYRVGSKTFDGYNKSGNGFENPIPGIDRARPSIPYKIASPIWGQKSAAGRVMGMLVSSCDGGYCKYEMKTSEQENDYYKSYQCRGHYYEGMVDPSGTLGDAKFFGLFGASKNYNGCEDKADQLGDLLGKFGGNNGGGMTPSLPSVPGGL